MQNINSNPIVATNASTRVKPTYGFVSTQEILNTLQAKGWSIASQQVSKTKVADKVGYQKHLIRLEHPDFVTIEGLSKNNASRPQLCLVNSHDGTSSLRLFYGLLRVACLNGIIAGSILKDFRAVHNQNVIKNLETGIDFMVNGIDALQNQVRQLQERQFSEAALSQFVKTMIDARLQNVGNVVAVDYNRSLIAFRPQDTERDAFTIFNIIQERVVRGGIRYQYEKFNADKTASQIVTTTTKRLTSIDSQVKLNRQAYNLAVELSA